MGRIVAVLPELRLEAGEGVLISSLLSLMAVTGAVQLVVAVAELVALVLLERRWRR